MHDLWLSRFRRQYHITKPDFEAKSFNLDRPSLQTRQNTKQQYHKDAYIALHHYHPMLLAKFWVRGNGVPRFISLDEVKKLGLFNAHGGALYTNPDVTIGKGGEQLVATIPNYVDIEQKKIDFQAACKMQASSVELANAKNSSVGEGVTRNSTMINEDNDLDLNVSNSELLFDEDCENMTNAQMRMYVKRLQKRTEIFYESTVRLDEANKSLKRKYEALQLAVKEETKKRKLMDKGYEKRFDELKRIGLTRYSMSNCLHYKLHPDACKEYYGFPNFFWLIGFIEEVIGIKYEPPKLQETKNGLGLSKFEQVLLTMFFTNTNFNYTTIGIIFGVKHRTTVGSYINKWMPILGEIGDALSSFVDILDEECYDRLEPGSYKALGLRNVSAVVDGKDVLCETVRCDRVLNSAQSSNKVNHSAFRFLTWSLTCGTVIERPPAFFGRASEKAILRGWGEHGRLCFPKGTCILGDKGFEGTSGYYTNYNITLHPAFLTSGHFNRDQVDLNIQIY